MFSPLVNLYGFTPQIPELSKSFNFPSRDSHPITLIIMLVLHFTFFNFSMSVLGCVSRKSTQTCSKCGYTTPFRYKNMYPILLSTISWWCPQSHWLSQWPLHIESKISETWQHETKISYLNYNCQFHVQLYEPSGSWFRFFGSFSYLHYFTFIHIGVYLSAICKFLWDLSAFPCQQKSGFHIYRVGYSSTYFFSRSWTKMLNKIASRTNPYWLVSWKVSSL